MGHLGLTPQSINKFGTYAVRAKEEAEAEKLIHDAEKLAEWGYTFLEDREKLQRMVAEMWEELPEPKKKKS